MQDLFGEVAVTWPQCVAWVHAVAPHMARTERSLQRYVDRWDVVGKVRRAIADGSLEAILTRSPYRPDLERQAGDDSGRKPADAP